ncbi:Peptidase family M48 [Cognatiyoonia koreensis]|uniref:Peptidase family M48 n=1 Tax=Cognatiyoonia koreensis TaxID=364200 RepID=A0A1I0N3W3_9RHOB|nr:M48 family metallopeptidase [Cognatiyoonia koreensis]SEV95501.1 Peptidase family M48 [Cognatiyoonia koreensis]
MFRRMMMLIGLALAVAGCAPQIPNKAPPGAAGPKVVVRPDVIPQVAPDPNRLDGRTAVRNFVEVVQTIEPVAEAICRQRAPRLNCDFQIVVDDAVNAPPNAFQTVDARGRPIIAFTVPLIAVARNKDELAFIMAHEAAHHIEGHLARLQRNAALGAELAEAVFGSSDARNLGAALGSRAYSKDFELEADALGALIAAQAGYDPLIGAEFFQRIPDPGNRFLGTHPGNAERFATVRRVVAGL